MFIIECPWCGARDQSEFSYHGEAHIIRPTDPQTCDEQQWGDYLFFRANPKGMHYERWVHAHGCRRWFNVARDTATDRIYESYKPGAPKPDAAKVAASKTAAPKTP